MNEANSLILHIFLSKTVQQYSARDLYVMWFNQELNNQITCISIFSNGSLWEVSKFRG